MDFNKLTSRARRRSRPRRSWRGAAATPRSTPSTCCSRCSTRSCSPTGSGPARRPSRGELAAKPSVAGRREPAAARLEPRSSACSTAAEEEARRLEDDYVSTEHLFLALEPAPRDEILAWIKKVARRPARHLAGPRGHLPGAREVRPRPDRGGRERQARPGDRPRRGDPPRDPGALAPHEEQPGADRRAGRRQDGDRRGARAADRRRRRPRGPEGQARLGARHRLAARRREVPRRVRGAAQGRARRDRPTRRAGSSSSSTSCTRSSARARPRAPSTRRNMLKPMLARGELRCVGATTLDEYRKHIEKDAALERRFQPVFVGEPSVAGHDRDPARPEGALRGAPRGADPRRGARRGRGALRPLHRRPAAARQGDRPRRRGRLAAADGDRLVADRARRGEPPRRCSSRSSSPRWPTRPTRCASRSSASSPRRRRRATRSPARWAKEKEALDRVGEITQRIDELRWRPSAPSGTGDLQRVAEIRYGELPALEQELAERARRGRRADGQGGGRRGRHRRSSSAAGRASRSSRLLEGETEKLIHMEERLHQRVVGQDEAVEAVANALRRARTGLQDPNRPIGSFVFLGPTGVGKTELARALAEFMFDDERAMVRLDMSRVPGAAHGRAARRRASGLRRLRGGRPADRGGAAAAVLGRPARRDREGARGGLRRAAADPRRRPADRRPGPHGRLPQHRDHHDVEHPLGRGDARALPAGVPEPDRRDRRVQAARRASSWPRSSSCSSTRLRARLAERGLGLELTDAAKEALAEAGWDPAYGARPLKRAIQRLVENPLALRLLEGDFHEGDTVRVDAQDGELVFAKSEAAAPAAA